MRDYRGVGHHSNMHRWNHNNLWLNLKSKMNVLSDHTIECFYIVGNTTTMGWLGTRNTVEME